MTTRRSTTLARLAAAALPAVLGGCLDRTLVVTSDPPGATVTVNDVELGRTPLRAGFTYYGDYDVRVELEGFEPLRVRQTARAPLYEYPPIDLAVTALPVRVNHDVRWHFTLTPALEQGAAPEQIEAGVAERARAMRDRLRGAATR
jgi:hypothetical protein